MAEQAVVVVAKQTRKVYGGVRKAPGVPDEISNNPELQDAMKVLPSNYNFEVPKTIWRIQQIAAKRVGLQMPEGLLMFSLSIADILNKFTGVDCVVLGDVTYGACCVDDLTAKALNVDLLVHYGHSCLIPVTQTQGIQMLYIFVDIKIDVKHAIDSVTHNFSAGSRIAFVSTIQFVSALQLIKEGLQKDYEVKIPQIRPLSPGEILGCTAPVIKESDVLIFVGDGRFHLEAAMIANPQLKAYRYNPYDKTLTNEEYDHKAMTANRQSAIDLAAKGQKFGLILGTLGRQGSVKVLDNLQAKLKSANKEYIIILLSEVTPAKLELFTDIDAWIQTSCPRLSIDWGTGFKRPLLTPYEAVVALEKSTMQTPYPMDYYAYDSLGEWTPSHREQN